ncbi:amino acid ABC transporter substrate-binding protein [Peptostreptococcus faecalis]|uniref:amino acid ABC transporter substrate-binding protein n=1 Tax=Peptostreptococcus faecalis TaxID=2045015 RepID=UPI000C7B45A9|nr:amino acid ABC transporter substrate-binding protein [Peptostreptococcus faecalis]
MKKGFIKKLLMASLSLVLVSTMVGCSSKDANSSENKDYETVIVGLDNTFVPMGFVDENNKLVGFDIDLANEVFKRIGITPQFENIDWSMKEQSLKNKNIDCLWNGYTITEERKKKVEFTKPYLDNKQIVVTMATEPFKKIDDLKDQPVGTQAASSSLETIENNEEFLALIKGNAPSTYDTFDKVLRDLEIGRIKAVVGDEVLLNYYMKQRGADKYKTLEGDLGKEQYAVGFRKEDTKLKDKIDKALDEIKNDGTFEKIKDKWFK